MTLHLPTAVAVEAIEAEMEARRKRVGPVEIAMFREGKHRRQVLYAMGAASTDIWDVDSLAQATGLEPEEAQVALNALTDTKKVKAQTGGWHLAWLDAGSRSRMVAGDMV